MAKNFLSRVFDLGDTDAARNLYEAWTESYDLDEGENGHATPGRCARALARLSDDMSAPVLDFCCGTGQSGKALAEAGFHTIDGVDLSEDKLKSAKEKSVYRKLRRIASNENPLPRRGEYSAVAAIGVLGCGIAPISAFDLLMKGLARGGKVVLSFSDHALRDPANEARLCEWLDCGAARLLFRQYGDHLPARGLKSYVYVIERA